MGEENDIQDVEETLDLPEVEEGEEDATDWKAEATKLQQKAIKQREKTKELKAKLKETLVPKTEEKPNEVKFSTGDKAFLKSYSDIKGADEISLAENWVNKYKLTPEELVEDEVFISKLTKLREAKAVKDAIPSNTRRSSTTDTKAVDYWLGKPFNEVPEEMRREVLNARLKQDEQSSKFGR